jgi:hypothetical protein
MKDQKIKPIPIKVAVVIVAAFLSSVIFLTSCNNVEIVTDKGGYSGGVCYYTVTKVPCRFDCIDYLHDDCSKYQKGDTLK